VTEASRPLGVTDVGYRAGERPGNYGMKLPPTLLQPDEVIRLMDACGQTQGGLRNRALIAVLYRSGALISEVLSLRKDELDREAMALTFPGGRLAARTIGMDPMAFRVLDDWLAIRAEFPGDTVFCSYSKPNPGRPLWPAYVNEMLRDLRPRAGLEDKRVHAGAFRLSLAAELLVEGWPLPYIQAQLGIVTLYAMDHFLKTLKIRPPEDAEVRAVIHTRGWDLPVDGLGRSQRER
jgi:site-specific recombinase XerD